MRTAVNGSMMGLLLAFEMPGDYVLVRKPLPPDQSHFEDSRSPEMPRSIIGLVAVLLLAASGWGQAIDKQVLDQIKDSSVFIKLKVPQVGEGSGSGFVIRTTGDTVLVMTNR